MKIKFPTGVEVEGTEEEIRNLLSKGKIFVEDNSKSVIDSQETKVRATGMRREDLSPDANSQIEKDKKWANAVTGGKMFKEYSRESKDELTERIKILLRKFMNPTREDSSIIGDYIELRMFKEDWEELKQIINFEENKDALNIHRGGSLSRQEDRKDAPDNQRPPISASATERHDLRKGEQGTPSANSKMGANNE